jgi:hypothetical protein
VLKRRFISFWSVLNSRSGSQRTIVMCGTSVDQELRYRPI